LTPKNFPSEFGFILTLFPSNFPSGSSLEVVPLSEYASKLAGLHDFLEAHCPSFVSLQRAQRAKVIIIYFIGLL
jgi:hypothetical protein